MGSPLSLPPHSMETNPGTIRWMYFPSHCFLFPYQKIVKYEEDQKGVMSYSNEHKCEATFTRI